MEEVAVGWRRLHNEELHNFSASQNIIRMIKSRRISGALIRDMKNSYETSIGKPEGKRPLGSLGVDGRLILEWILGK
jgi:hypothetical protein